MLSLTVFQSHGYEDLCFQCSSLCLEHLVWGRLLSFLCALVSFAFVVSFAKSLVPDWISALHMLFDVSSCLHLTMEDLSSQALVHFLGWMH